MNRKIFAVILAVFLLWPINILANTKAIPSPQQLEINEETTDITGYNIDGYNYYMLRDLAVGFGRHGLDFSLWGDDKAVVINKDKVYVPKDTSEVDKTTVQNPIKKQMRLQVIENNQKRNYPVDVYNIGGYNFFKLRDLGEILGYGVDYDEVNDRAVVTIKRESKGKVTLGNERLLSEYSHLIDGKRVGLVTNQTGIDSRGRRTVDKINDYPGAELVAIYSPEHGLDGKTRAGAWVESYTDKTLNLPVYSIYGKTREPSMNMLKNVDVLIFDIQDIGSRTYTYVSTMNYSMKAAKKAGIPFVVLDRPNPLGDTVEGYTVEPKYLTFVGVDETPLAHGMTIGELAQFYNRKIGVDLTVVPMTGYKRDMVWQDTGLPFSQTSPNIPDLKSAFNYMATGMGDGTGVHQGLQFSWVGHKDIDGRELEARLNSENLPGIRFKNKKRSSGDGVELIVTDYRAYNPARTGYTILATFNQMVDINVPVETKGEIPMFEKIQGSDKMGKALLKKWSASDIINDYQKDVEKFKQIRKDYLIYD